MNLHVFGPAFSTFVRSVRLYCEEKELAYTCGMSLSGQPISWKSEAHRALHPFGKVPVLLHDGTQVFETMAICRYLDAMVPSPVGSLTLAHQTLVEQWSSALVTSVDAALVRNYILPIAGPNRTVMMDAKTREAARLEVAQTLAILDAQLREQPFLCGEHWSMADALLIPMLDYLARITEPVSELSAWPRLTGYLERMRARPSTCAVLQSPAGEEVS